MTLVDEMRRELLDATDEAIEDACNHADPMVLRGLLYQLTGDEELLRIQLQSAFRSVSVIYSFADERDVAMVRRKAADWLKRHRDAGAPPVDIGPMDRLPQSMSLAAGEELRGDHLAMCLEELALDPWARSLQWKQQPSPERLQQFSVVVIGAGLGGLNAAVQLKRAGIPYTVIEKNSGVGGTWFENRYPGARVDSQSRSYTHIYSVDYEYPYAFCPWEENQKHFDWVADAFDIRKNIVFNTEVLSLRWDEPSAMWEVQIDGPNGQSTLRANAVITAVGFLNRPKTPDFEGLDQFEGQWWHSARWPDGVSMRGKRVAVIGTGATGYQMIPELALEAEHVTVFQRTPQWLFEVPGYRSPLPHQVNWLDRNLPFHTNFSRLRSLSGTGSPWGPVTEIDPEFDDPHAVSATNKLMRDGSVAFLARKLGGDPELLEKMIPPHPPWSGRPVLVDPEYSVLDALMRDNVTLVTDGIRRMNRTGIEAQDGSQYDVDVIVFAIGFHATEYLYPMSIIGRDGKTVEELWREGGARAYTFSMIPGFPNLWSLYGPNSNGGLGVGAFHELLTRYALECMERLIVEDKKEIEVKEDAYWRFARVVDEKNSRKVWSDPRAHNYYWTQHGRSAVMCPFWPVEVFQLLRHPNYDDMEIR